MSTVRNNNGFTLIELSIVLVIVALIVAGVMTGSQLIESTKTRKMTTRFEQFTSAYNIFRNKYNCIPGDCINASQFGLGTSGNGDSNVYSPFGTSGLPCYSYDANAHIPNAAGECQRFWVHLANAGLIEGNYSELPMLSTDPDVGKYFPPFIDGSSYIYLVNYENKFFFRTGLNSLSPMPEFGVMAVKGHHMISIARKYGVDLTMFIGCTEFYPGGNCTGVASKPIIPMGFYYSAYLWWVTPHFTSGDKIACVSNPGGTWTNAAVNPNGECNLLWALK